MQEQLKTNYLLEEIVDSLARCYSLEELQLRDDMLFIIEKNYGIQGMSAEYILKGAEGIRQLKDEVSRCIECVMVLH